MALSTKNISNKVSKILEPGNHTVEILSVSLESVPFNKDAYHLTLQCAGPDMGPGFEGFFIDVNDQDKGRYKGQVGRVRYSYWVFADGYTKTGVQKFRDIEIMKAINNLCFAIGQPNWVNDMDGKCNTIKEFIDRFNEEKLFKGKLLRVCLGGKEYLNKQSYTNYDLFIVKSERNAYGFESADIPENLSKVIKFDPKTHLIPLKKEETVKSFSKPITEATKNQFSLD